MEELGDVDLDFGLKGDDTLLREDVRDNLALTGVLTPIPNVEETALNRDESVVEFRLQCAISVTVDGIERHRVGNGYVVRSNTDDWT